MTLHAPVHSFMGTVAVGVKMKEAPALVDDKVVQDWINIVSVEFLRPPPQHQGFAKQQQTNLIRDT